VAVTEDLLIKIQVDSKNANKSLELITNSLAEVNASLGKIEKTSVQGQKAFGGIGGAAIKMNQALELAKKGFTFLFEPLKNMVKEFQASQDEITRLGKTLQLMGNRDVNGTVQHFQELADQLKENTTVEDELVISLARVGSTLDLTTAQIDKMIETAIDMAAVTGGSVDSAFQGLVQTLRGNARGAGELAILLQDLTKEELEAGKGVDILNAKLKGMAKSEATTSLGKMAIVMRELGDLGKDIGKILSEGLGLGSAGDDALKTIKSIREEIASIKPVAVDVITYIRALISGISGAFKEFDFSKLIDSIANLTKNFLILTAALSPFLVLIGAVYLSLSTLGPMILSNAKAMLSLSAATAGAAIKFTLLAASIGVAAIALDFWITNIRKTGNVIGLFVGNIRQGFIGIFSDIFEKMGWDTLADHLRKKQLELVNYTEEVGKDLKQGALAESFDQLGNAAKGFSKGFDSVADSAYTAQNSVQQFGNGVENVSKKIKGMTDEGKKLIQELAESIAKLNKELTEVGASEGQKIAINNAERIRELGLLEQKLAKERALGPIQKQQLKDAVAISNAIAAKQSGELRKKNLTEEIDKTKALANQIADMNATTMERIQMEKQAGLDAIEKRREELSLDKEINKEALAHLDAQAALLDMKSQMAAEKAPDASFEAAQMAGADLGASVAKAFQGPAMGMLAGAGAFADAVQGLIDFVPQMLEKITNVFNSLSDLPNKIVEGFSNLSSAILGLLSNFIPRVFEMIKKLPEILIQFFTELPARLADLFANLPDIILGLADKFPELVEKLISAIIPALPKIVVSLVKALIEKGPQIAIALAKAMAIEIPKAIIMGLINGIKEALSSLTNAFKKPFKDAAKALVPDPKALALGMRAAAKALTGEASKLFAVMDLTDTAKTADTAKDLGKKVTDAGKDAMEKLDKTGSDFFKGLKDAWEWVMDHIIQPLIDGILAVWRWVYDNVISPLIDGIRAVWEWLYNKVVLPLIEGISKVFQWVIDNVINPLVEGISKVFQWVIDHVIMPLIDGIAAVFQWVMDHVITPLIEGIKAVWEKAKELLDPIVQAFKDVFQAIKENFDKAIEGLVNFATSIKEKFDSAIEGLKDFATSIKEKFDSAIQGLKDAGGDVKDKLGEAATKLKDAFSNALDIGARIWNGFKDQIDAWNFGAIGGKIWEGLKNGLGNIGNVIKDQLNAINPASMFSRIFSIPDSAYGDRGPVEIGLGTDIPYVKFARGGMVPGQSMTNGDSLLNDRILALLSPGEAVIPKSAMKDPLIAKLVDMIMGGNIPAFARGGYASQASGKLKASKDDPIGTVVNEAANIGAVVSDTVKQVTDQLDPKKLWEGVLGQVSQAVLRIFESNKFHEGGEVPAMLRPGEYVINAGAAQSIGTPTLDAINRGQSTGSQTINQTVNLNITTTQPIDEQFIRNKIYPVVKEQIKRASADGQTMVYTSGVRQA
jgi:phage-related protein